MSSMTCAAAASSCSRAASTGQPLTGTDQQGTAAADLVSKLPVQLARVEASQSFEEVALAASDLARLVSAL